MIVQTFWSRYKVIITGALMAVFTALAPLLMSKNYDTKMLIVVAVIGLATFIGKEARGKNWTMGGQVSAALIALSAQLEGDLDWTRLVVACVVAFFSVPLSPIKLSTYESSAPILEAKEEAKEIKQVRDAEANLKK